MESLRNKLPESLLKKDLAQMLFYDLCEVFKSIFFAEPLPVTTSYSSGRYLKTYIKITSVESIIVTLMPKLNLFLSSVITLEAAIQNNLTKSWRFLREMSLVEFCCSMTL